MPSPNPSDSRRQFLWGSSLALLTAALPQLPVWGQARRSSAAAPTPAAPPSPAPTGAVPPTAAEALAQLKTGNLRFQKGQLTHPNETLKRRRDVALKQAPFATVLACADSRESPELIFDQGLGDLFVARTAGHVLDNAVVGTLEFAVAELQVPLLVVMGHQRCGAIKATLQAVATSKIAPGSLETLVDGVRPAVLLAQGEGDERFTSVVKANVRITIERLQNSRLLAQAVTAGQLQIVGAYYQLDTGVVEFLS